MIYEYEGLRPQIDPSAYIHETAIIIGAVTVGKNCYIGPNVVVHSEFSDSPIVLSENVALEDAVIVHVGHGGCVIGKNVTVGHAAIVHGLKLCDNSNEGMGAVVSSNSVVGEYSIVAEGAVVKNGQQIPAGVVVGGTPAAILREVQERDKIYWKNNNDFYVNLGRKCKSGLLKRLD